MLYAEIQVRSATPKLYLTYENAPLMMEGELEKQDY